MSSVRNAAPAPDSGLSVCIANLNRPSAKDKTLVEILERLRSVESKIDGLGIRGNLTPPLYSVSQASVYPTPGPFVADADVQVPVSASSAPPASPAHSNSSGSYRYVSSVYQMLQWPVVHQILNNMEHQGRPCGLGRSGNNDLLVPRGLRSSPNPLPLDGLQPANLPGHASISNTMPYGGAPTGSGMTGLVVDWETIQTLSKAYFDLYNFMYPLLDRRCFSAATISNVLATGFEDSAMSVLALLVLSLGEVAMTMPSGIPISIHKGRASGIKGGTLDRPPGLAFFNEARKRMGFALTDVSVENVQIFVLAALYYESCGRSTDCWRMTVSASVACQMLINSRPNESQSPQSGLIRRLYWHCCMMESSMHMEFEMPLTGLERLDTAVGLPDFDEVLSEEDYIGNQSTHYLEHFASQIVLHRLLAEFHSTLMTSFESGPLPAFPAATPLGFSSEEDGAATIKQLAARLDQWRGMLPSHLHWQENHPPSPFSDNVSFHPVFPEHQIHSSSIFTVNGSEHTAKYSCGADMLAAMLRTRYYHARYLLHRPFIFKALHHHDTLTHEDAEGAAVCLRSCLKWPVAMPSASLNKRLVPMSFFWSQNMFGVLVLLHVSRTHPVLARVRSSYCGPQFEFEASETINLYIEWLRDLRNIDPTTTWCWDVVRVLYGLEE
ncbi:hypothetical protein S7711_07862 [Stachybotrys chartarum IBT 7711]|uniref:Xylanolytic transcriptional activator regulatory domain-containing protein n=1 Tax=Stachybotrys chartarum (strain CBS 109288 / IBT 7711) TaxID=1280523 RepID=A0A084AXP8_STACB|nr:hypothetical protein S7711_07862 [Stachybotrys chartarum IBT 7711]